MPKLQEGIDYCEHKNLDKYGECIDCADQLLNLETTKEQIANE